MRVWADWRESDQQGAMWNDLEMLEVKPAFHSPFKKTDSIQLAALHLH